MLPPPEHDAQQVRQLADDILADPRYRVGQKPLIDRVLEWFGEQLSRIIGSLASGGSGSLVAWAFVLGAILLVSYLVVRHGRLGRLPASVTARAETMVELTRTPDEWRAEAAMLEAMGRWAEGLRARHRAMVADLVGRGVIPDEAGRTAGEYVRDVAAALPDGATAMAAATELFEAAWYGGARTGAAEAARFAELDRQVLQVRVPA